VRGSDTEFVCDRMRCQRMILGLYHECWGLHQIGSAEYPVDGSSAPSFSVRPRCTYTRQCTGQCRSTPGMRHTWPSSTLPKLAQTVAGVVLPLPGCTFQICSDCDLSAGDALNCAQDRAVWRTYATASSALRWRRRRHAIPLRKQFSKVNLQKAASPSCHPSLY